MRSVSVLGVGVHDGSDGAVVELVSREKVTLIYTNPGYCYDYSYNEYSWMGLTEVLAVV